MLASVRAAHLGLTRGKAGVKRNAFSNARFGISTRASAWVAFCTLTALSVLLEPSQALAHPALERATAAADEGHFAEALTILDETLRGTGLTRTELVDALRQRVLLHFALGQSDALLRDARTLLTIEPEVVLGEAAPPELEERVRAAAHEVVALSAHVTRESLAGGLRVSLQTSELDPNLFRTEIGIRSADSPWQTTSGRELRYPASQGVTLDYYAVVIGPGGAVVAGEGAVDAPLEYQMPAAPPPPMASTEPPPPSHALNDGRQKWWWIGGGSLAIVATVVVVSLFAAREDRSSESDVQSPTVDYP